MFELDWLELRAVGPAAPGQRAVIVARVASLRIENPIVVTHVERSNDRFEMWLAAQPGHPLRGEEVFIVSRRSRPDGSIGVDFELRSTSVPHAPIAWLGYPILRALQHRFARDAAAAMRGEPTSIERRGSADWHGYLRWSAGVGLVAWLVTLAWMRPGIRSETWGSVLLLLAAFVCVPWLLTLVEGIENSRHESTAPTGSSSGVRSRAKLESLAWRVAASTQLLAALSLALSFMLERGTSAAMLSAPWLITTAAMALVALQRILRQPRRLLAADTLCFDAAFAFPLVGAAWTLLSRMGARPLEFSDQVVLLTGVHFHFAGLALPLAAGLAVRSARRAVGMLTAILVVAGTPLVATGITLKHLSGLQVAEAIAAWTMALGGLFVAGLHAREALRQAHSGLQRALFGAAALSLAFGMLLAIAFGSRAYVDIGELDYGWMRALHGSANALGFALPALAAWLLSERREPKLERS